ncbi:HupE/UreJ family protein [uncultured Paraglaciecola sp.]|uniref:HupE/UreJ family protein n=1 Tax=uncultured Paraglaciecola sp. TaxID=1765024 RepID=UPI00260ABBF3|nr:HupE/UreJ family protein [uncultured Paraglaciecola sp.]
MLARIFWLLLFASFSFSLHAHQMSTGYLNLDLSASQEQGVQGQLQLRWFDINSQVQLDKNLDGNLQWQEVKSRETQLMQFISNHLKIEVNQQLCTLITSDELRSDYHFDEGYMSYSFVTSCKIKVIDELVVRYSALFAQDPEHKLIINLNGTGDDMLGIGNTVVSADQQVVAIDIKNSGWLSVMGNYIYQGIVHIFIGTDHILFLIVLVLTSVLIYKNGKWIAKLNNSLVIRDTIWIITAFTLAHSLTLTATALGWLAPSSRWVEFGIAISIVLTSINNVWPVITRLSWVTFGFGLLHGMGFASVLGELGLSQEYTLLSILAFNLGVEVGQILILLAVLPILFLCRSQKWYPNYGLKICSILIGLVAINWSLQRF